MVKIKRDSYIRMLFYFQPCFAHVPAPMDIIENKNRIFIVFWDTAFKIFQCSIFR